jgi:hypothetical protein
MAGFFGCSQTETGSEINQVRKANMKSKKRKAKNEKQIR